MSDRYDVLVLGGGAAGCVLAGRLTENPARSVCLVEAGPDYGHYDEGRWPVDILDARWLALDSHCWERDDEEDRSQLRARVLGGCSAHNACVILRGAPEDYDEWGHGWSYAELEPYLRRAEQALRVRPTPEEELSPWHRAFAEVSGKDAILHPVNAVGDVRWHTGFAYVDQARGRPNLTVLADTLVGRVLVEDGRAAGVLAGGRELRADVVVVSAGAYGSPGILLRSGIGRPTSWRATEPLSSQSCRSGKGSPITSAPEWAGRRPSGSSARRRSTRHATASTWVR